FPGPDWLIHELLLAPSAQRHDFVEDVISDVTLGRTVILLDRLACAVTVDTHRAPNRAIEEPTAEPTLWGPHEGLIESITQNLALIRKRVRHRHFKVEQFKVG